MMTTKEFIIVTIYNVIVIFIFGALAVFFNHWWILLFSILLCSFPSVVHRYYRICDKCGRKSKYASTEEEALNEAIADGWVHYPSNDADYCPNCKESLNEVSK